MGSLVNIIGSAAVGTCMMSMSFVIFSLFAFLRNLPAVFTFTRRVLGWLMVMTLSLYQPILLNLKPVVLRHTGIDLLQPLARTISSIMLSLVLLVFSWITTGWDISAFGAGLAILHGLSVGLIWDAIGSSEGLQIGEKLE